VYNNLTKNKIAIALKQRLLNKRHLREDFNNYIIIIINNNNNNE